MIDAPLSRRALIGGLGLVALLPAIARAQSSAALSRGHALASDFGLIADSDADQSALLQQAVDTASGLGLPLHLDAGTFRVSGIRLPSGMTLTGLAGRSTLSASSTGPVLAADSAANLVLRDFRVEGRGPADDYAGLISLVSCPSILLDNLDIAGSISNGLFLQSCSGRVTGLSLSGHETSAIFAVDSTGLSLTQNRITDCGNSGIRVWRNVSGKDGTIVSGNQISAIDWRGGGDGQNGNGINIFLADEVIVSDNHIVDCAFTAVRANTTNNTQISGNTCRNCGEVAIFSEFAFSGSVISDNIIDGAATGISITNLDDGGRLATCTGNIVRNIFPRSEVNPDTTPVGIFAEADTVIANNVVEAVPGIGIGAGWGPFLRNVLVTANVVRDCDYAIAVSVVDGAGTAKISGNLISAAKISPLAGFAWTEIISPDLAADAGKFPQLSISDNSVV